MDLIFSPRAKSRADSSIVKSPSLKSDAVDRDELRLRDSRSRSVPDVEVIRWHYSMDRQGWTSGAWEKAQEDRFLIEQPVVAWKRIS